LEDLNNYQKNKLKKQEKSTSVCGLNDGRFEKQCHSRPQGNPYWGGKRILEYGTIETIFLMR
jgi:hypothetical protein